MSTSPTMDLKFRTEGEKTTPRLRKNVPSLQPCDLWMVELGDRVAGWLGSENLAGKGVRFGSIVRRALPRAEWKERQKQGRHFEKSCLSKRRYHSAGAAHAAIVDAQLNNGLRLYWYGCTYCGGVHLTRKLPKRLRDEVRAAGDSQEVGT